MRQAIHFLLCALLLTSVRNPAFGQQAQTMKFQFEHNGVSYTNGSAQVKLVADPANKELQLVFTNVSLGSNEPGSGLKMVLKDDCIYLSSNNLQLQESPPRGLALSKDASIKRRISITGTGKAFVRIDKLYCRPEGGEDRLIRLNSPVNFEYEIGGAAAAEPAPDSEITSGRPLPKPPRPQPQPTPARQAEDPAVVAWREALKKPAGKERERALQKYIDNYPEAVHVKDAKKQVELGFVAQPSEGGMLVFRIRYALCTPELDTTQFNGTIEPAPDGSADFLLKLSANRSESFELPVADACKAENVRVTNLFISGNPLKCVLTSTETDFVLTFSGGSNSRAPFIVEYLQDGKSFPKGFETIAATDAYYTFPISRIREKTGTYGVFTLQVLEDEIILPVEGGLVVPPPPPVWPYAVAVLALALAAFLYSKHQKHKRKKAVEAKVKKKEEEPPVTENWVPLQPPASGSTMKIRSAARSAADHKALSEADFEQLLEETHYRRLNMAKHWPDTVLTELYLSPRSIRGISDFLHDQRKTMLEEEEGSIPEIGGFLLGKYCVSEKTGKYRVALTDFVPIVPEEHNVYQLQFSTESLVRELGDMQDNYPDLSLVGWFHTHPGHGLFLSRPDLTIHDGFFREKYQFAMEIDTMTPHLDTGFFTRTTAGPVNNTETQAPELTWFHWKDIEQHNKP